jgi:D-lactate dehydrogenase
LKSNGANIIALRCAGFNNVDLKATKRLGFNVVRVPAYSPQAVAEHSIALLQTLNRHTHRAYNRVRDSNFSIEGFIGFDLYKKNIGIIGMGKIG